MSTNLVQLSTTTAGRRGRKCANPACAQGVVGRRDKKFCSPRCKSSYHNEVIKKENESIYQSEKVVRHNEKQLRELFSSARYAKTGVPLIILQDRAVRLELYSQLERNTRTGQNILWSFRYGLEAVQGRAEYFIIHHRTKLN